MDFSENYAFTIQDEAQGYHWNSNSCTLHPVIIYCKNQTNEKNILPLCIISEDLKHDVGMVHKIQEVATAFIKKKFAHITQVHYFTDGCAGQYKNKFSFINLCLHEKDFQLKAQWSFHATSHGKTECDGIGGTVKCGARKESYKRELGREILTTKDLFEFCKSSFKNIDFHIISKEEVDSTRQELENRFKLVETIPGTRMFHNFKPKDDLGTIEVRRISSDEKPTLIFNLCSKQPTSRLKIEQLYSGCFVASVYDNLWYFGMVSEVNEEEKDVTVNFMHPPGPSPSFFWPKRGDVCAVPIPHVLAIVEPPKTTTGRTYQFSEDCMTNINSIFENTRLN